MAEYRSYTRKVDPSFAWTEHKKDKAKVAKKASRRKAINAIVDKYFPGLKTHGMAFDLGPEEKMAMDKELKRYGTTYDEEIWRDTKSRASKPKNVKSMGKKQAERRAAARTAPSRGMSLAQLERASRQELLPTPHYGGPAKSIVGRMTDPEAIKEHVWWQDAAGEASIENEKAFKSGKGIGLHEYRDPSSVPGYKRRALGQLEASRKGMAQKLLKGGGSIRLPQMSKAMLPIMLMGLLAGGMGMGGNEDLDGLLG